MKEHLRKADFIIYAIAILLIAAALLYSPSAGNTLEVKAGDLIYAFPLDKNGIYSVEGAIGTTEIEILDGRARIISSPCPNKTCISSGFQNTLVCLPNKVIATVNAGAIDESTF